MAECAYDLMSAISPRLSTRFSRRAGVSIPPPWPSTIFLAPRSPRRYVKVPSHSSSRLATKSARWPKIIVDMRSLIAIMGENKQAKRFPERERREEMRTVDEGIEGPTHRNEKGKNYDQD